jgi:uncharacterized protein YjbI with pentapeptide repeats
MLNRRSLAIAALALLGLGSTFLLLILVQRVAGANLRGTILSGGVIGAIVGFVGVLVGQYLAQRRHSQSLLQAQELEAQRAHEAALQNYFEQVGNLLIEQPLRQASPGDNLSTVVRAQTLAVLAGLDADRKRILLQFLQESGLIEKEDEQVVSLYGADLREGNLSRAALPGANLRGTDLSAAILIEADLREADLSNADLGRAFLVGAVGKTNVELEQQAYSLEGATMPNSHGYEYWRESMGSGEDGKDQ